MADIKFDNNPQTIEMSLPVQEIHFNFARPFMRFNQTPGLFDFDGAAQEIHFDIEGSVLNPSEPVE